MERVRPVPARPGPRRTRSRDAAILPIVRSDDAEESLRHVVSPRARQRCASSIVRAARPHTGQREDSGWTPKQLALIEECADPDWLCSSCQVRSSCSFSMRLSCS